MEDLQDIEDLEFFGYMGILTYLSNQSITSVMPGAEGCLTRENTQECWAIFARCRAVFVDFFTFSYFFYWS